MTMFNKELTKDQLRTKELVAQMSGPEKIKYYYSTYKWHALGIGIVLALLIWLIVTQITHNDPSLYIGLVNSTDIDHQMLVSGVEEKLDGGYVSFYRDLGAGESNFNGDFSMLTVYLASGELNVIFSDEVGVQFLANQSIGTPIDEWASPALKSLWADRITEFDYALSPFDTFVETLDELDTIPKALAFDISETKVAEKLLLSEETHYIMAIYTEGYENALYDFCEYLYDLETK